MSASRYKSKPVEVEAVRWDGGEKSQREIVNWAGGAVTGWFDSEYFLTVRTPTGDRRVSAGDWVVRGVKGQFDACKSDIFDATYEPVPAVSGGSDRA